MLKVQAVETIKRTPFYGWYRRNFYETSVKDYNKEIIDIGNANQYIINCLIKNKPMMVSRLGSTELKILKSFHHKEGYTETKRDEIQYAAGVFPNDDLTLDRFSKLYFESVKSIDLLGVWFNPFEDILANEYCPDAELTKLKNLEPYFSDNPWSYYLKGKKVLVINPFATSIEMQYKKRKKLFKNSNVLPEFELITYRPVISFDGNPDYETWFDALEFMKNEISEIDFDVAIIGAGAYGLPLASYIKEMGRQAIHMGGSTQMLFGVYGRRWEILPNFQEIINKDWIKPVKDEKPKSARKVENACYW